MGKTNEKMLRGSFRGPAREKSQRSAVAEPKVQRGRRWPWLAALMLWWALLGLIPAALAAGKATLPEFTLRSWDGEDGMPLAEARAVARTPDGYLWIATSAGLARFDGARFVVMTTNDTPVLGDNRIISLLADAAGNLWIGTEAGTLARRQAGRFLPVTARPSLHGQAITSLTQDRDGTIWLATRGRGVARLQAEASGGFTAIFFSSTNGLPGDRVSRIHTDRQGKLWAIADGMLVAREADGWKMPTAARDLPPVRTLASARDGGLWVATTMRGDGGARIFKLLADGTRSETGGYPWRPDALRSMVDALCEDDTGRLWAGSFGGGVYFRRPGEEWERLTTEGALSQNIVTSMLETEPGALWLTLESGQLFQVHERLVSTMRLPPPNNEVAIKAACASRDGSLWIGTEGDGVFRLRDGVTTRFGMDQGLGNGKIGVIFEDRRTNLWVGTWAGLYRFDGQRFQSAFPPDYPTDLVVLSLFEDSQGNLWVGTVFNILCLRNGQIAREYTALKSASAGFSQYQEINSFAEDRAGRIWATVGFSGLFRLEGEEFQRVGGGQWTGEGSTKRVYCDSRGALWITTWGNGLFRLQDGKFRQWTARDGLPSDTLQAMIEDDAGRLWIGSINGIFGCSTSALDRYVRGQSPPLSGWSLSVAEGLEDRFCSGVGDPIVTRNQDGRLAFPNQRALAQFDPEQVVQARTRPLPLLLEEVLVDGVAMVGSAVAGEVRLKSDARRLEIFYTVPDFQTPNRQRFLYQLEGYDPDWVDAGTRRVAYYNHLTPGDYDFRVVAGGVEGGENANTARLRIEVVPTFWERRLVQVAAGVLLVAALVAAVLVRERGRSRRRLAQLQAQRAIESERSRIAQDIHDDLGASLTRIAWLGELAETDQAAPNLVQTHARKITSYARQMLQSLDEIVWAVNPRNDTLQSLVQYISYYANETFGPTTINCRFEAAPDLPAINLSSELRHDLFLAVKEAINNILKHAAATWVQIKITTEGDELKLTIEDDGRGFDPTAAPTGRQGQGLGGLRRRLERAGGNFQCESAEGRGTRLFLAVRLTELAGGRV